MSNMKNLMESIDDIYEADDESFEQPEAELSATELLKEIVGSLRELSGKVVDGSIEDISSLTSDLQNISNSLKELVSPETDDFGDSSESDEELEEDHGAEDFGPYIDKDGVQNYEVAAAEADSYPQQKGFVGI